MSILTLINAALQKHGWLIARLPIDEEVRAAQLVELLVEDNADGRARRHTLHPWLWYERPVRERFEGKIVASPSRARSTGAGTEPGIRLVASFAPNSGGWTSRQKRPTGSQMRFGPQSTWHCFAGSRGPTWQSASCLPANPAIATLTTMSPAI